MVRPVTSTPPGAQSDALVKRRGEQGEPSPEQRLPLPRLAELRETAGETAVSLAAWQGTSTQTLWRWETGRVPIPERHREALAQRFGVTIPYLMRYEETPTR